VGARVYRISGAVRRGSPSCTAIARPGGSRGEGLQQPSATLLRKNVQRFRGGLVLKAHRLCVSLNSRLESIKEEKKTLKGVSTPPEP